ncbi:ABC transporter G family member 28-like [Cynara cardunculus var. scolymus]|uniref:ABC transporter G family member 28-like n=1 Tax=Cynara cardunculus var. scolymus TaxID=59895 RepID=UPI000D623885|nr:ABC transporter G family member 28-like [Cynara cardunculus var. scolymus]
MKINLIFTIFLTIILGIQSPNGTSHLATAQQYPDADTLKKNPAKLDEVTKSIYTRFNDISLLFHDDAINDLSFCMKNITAEWNEAFDFSHDTKFLSNCIQKTNGNIARRLCTAADIKFYVTVVSETEKQGFKTSSYVKGNTNCNLTSWVPGCEPGWACAVGKDVEVNLKNKDEMPFRTFDCQPCCEGFFCPTGLTCMIPCPAGSYCPLARLNPNTNICDPYRYQPPPGVTNHSCGGADVWAAVVNSREVFCPAGFFCPSSIEKYSCEPGHYCRLGSTKQAECYQLAKCDKEADHQNITAYGLMICGALTLLLLFFYNCTDQVISTRERRKAKSREAAALNAKELAQERWKSAKEGAKKKAVGIQSSFSQTFSRKKLSISDMPKDPGQSSLVPGAFSSKDESEDQNNLTLMMRDIEEDPESHDGFNMEIGDKSTKKGLRPKKLHTRSQIFKYAYGEIEKEKALQQQNSNLRFSGVIPMATDTNIRSRPRIEVSFQNLTLTLKGKNKHLLRCVTGKISPGRVSAVMGPSGAGKTTFLSALTGKARGCTVNGSILINGKNQSMNSYKKIIGFVPQDDIVHGDLTVEENLWFSAKCRLPAKLSRAEKVLVVERVIESLGLHPVRNSLVGTVEKRGISGGQRKRVNVGLEMVMEPSLLILDEPTSGLDSSSSQLLLRALRREAHEAVNVCMVVHQPSYSLFRMFDDLILLAKGGLVAYLGPVKRVEEYFSGLGIHVPERVNPPDHYIDILEGIVKPNTSSAVNYKELPVKWMCHNGYPVPPDMMGSDYKAGSSAGLDSAEGSSSGSTARGADDQSFAGELWQEFKLFIHMKSGNFLNCFSRKDLSNRITPGVCRQYRYFLGRVAKQRIREARLQAVDFLLLLIAGISLGTLAKVSDENFGAVGYTYTIIAFSLLGKIAAMRSFTLDKLQFWRERSSGMSCFAYFFSKDTIDHFNTVIKPAVYLCTFYYFNPPRSSILDNYIILLCLLYCVSGFAYALAIYLEPGSAQLWSVLLPVVLTLIASQNEDKGSVVTLLKKVCYPSWALEAFLLANAERYRAVWLLTRCAAIAKRGYDLRDWKLCLIRLLVSGLVFRILALFLLVAFQKK